MKNIVTKAAVIACLLSPVMASAATTYGGSSPSDPYTFTLAVQSNVAIDYSWSDMLLTKNGYPTKEYNATALDWTLSGGTPQAIPDATGTQSATGTISIMNLAAGTYTLTLAGAWNSVTLAGVNSQINGWQNQAGTVNLVDGDGGTFNSFRVTPVPEPESYAMLLAGLGLVGTIAIRRRNQNNA